ncbi:MAG TPA: single-stranded-DNA-specific exonuclease RecJ [Aestuariivirgaceae bacterium]|nr:single-stranded-DNA-specific exonuclease RecJ [Aestuariivirgaceae bacterium]
MTEAGHFLDVGRSLTGRHWRARLRDGRTALAIAERLGIPEILGRVLAGRGIAVDGCADILSPRLRALMPQPAAIRDLEAGADRLARAIITGEMIGIISDYDVDGISSAALLVLYLRAFGITPKVHIPDRIAEGYGPSRAAVEGLAGQGVKLLVTLDCGVNAHDPLLAASALGLDTVVVDHHLAGPLLPEAHAVINPNRQDDLSGQGHLCAAGLTLILAAATSRVLRQAGHARLGDGGPDLLGFLDLVALATVCDVVPLATLNRAYVQQGLKVMARRENIGLAALADMARLKRRPDPYALGFLLGPRLNAAGRVGHAMAALRLLTTEDRGEANMLAQQLETLNRERQAIEIRVLETALFEAERALGLSRSLPVLLVCGENWHPGVLGLVAARLAERYRLPSFALGHQTGGLLAHGSGRSLPGVDIGAAIRDALAEGHLVKGGGHVMAAGLTVERAKLGRLRGFLEERLAAAVADVPASAALDIDGALTASGATLDLVELLERAGPYGSGNPAPVFAFPAHRVLYADLAGHDHVRCTLVHGDGTQLRAVAFRALSTVMGETLLKERDRPLHVAGRLTVDDYNGRRGAQLMIDDVALIGA